MPFKVALIWAIIVGCLKAAGVVAWSWWAVFGPLAVVGVVVAGAMLVILVCALLAVAFEKK